MGRIHADGFRHSTILVRERRLGLRVVQPTGLVLRSADWVAFRRGFPYGNVIVSRSWVLELGIIAASTPGIACRPHGMQPDRVRASWHARSSVYRYVLSF